MRIEHAVPDFDDWRQAFDSDPVGRERSGVRRYQVHRAIDDPNHVFIDLEFDTTSEAESFLAAMRSVWERVQGRVIWDPQQWRLSSTNEQPPYR